MTNEITQVYRCCDCLRGSSGSNFNNSFIKKSKKHYNSFLVFDSSQTWPSQWQRQFAAQQIPQLRSPAVHHPDPNPFQLRNFDQARYNELFPPYHRPGTKLFNDFCHEVVCHWKLTDKVYPAKEISKSSLQDFPHLFGTLS